MKEAVIITGPEMLQEMRVMLDEALESNTLESLGDIHIPRRTVAQILGKSTCTVDKYVKSGIVDIYDQVHRLKQEFPYGGCKPWFRLTEVLNYKKYVR